MSKEGGFSLFVRILESGISERTSLCGEEVIFMLRKTTPIPGPIFLSLVVSLILTLPATALADSTGSKASGKLVRGVVNASTGWIEIFQGIYEVSAEKDPVTGVLYGPIHGVGMAIVRTGSGVYETVTFLIPFPARYRSTIDPAFVWEHWGFFGGLEEFVVKQNLDSP